MAATLMLGDVGGGVERRGKPLADYFLHVYTPTAPNGSDMAARGWHCESGLAALMLLRAPDMPFLTVFVPLSGEPHLTAIGSY